MTASDSAADAGGRASSGALALAASTIAFTLCFSSWVLNAVLASYLAGVQVFPLDESGLGWLLAAPILTGALTRVPLGMLTDRYGGRIVLTLVILGTAVFLGLLSVCNTYASYLACSLGLGLAGGSFAVGVGYVSVCFGKQRQGVALGVFGLGNAGAALTTAIAPRLLELGTQGGAFIDGWRMVPRTYAVMLVITAAAFFLVAPTRVDLTSARKSLAQRFAPLRDIVVWRFSFYYFLLFGGFVALAQWLVPYGINSYALSVASAGLIASAFSLPAGVFRVFGGWMSDRVGPSKVMYWVFGGVIALCLVLGVPRMDIVSPGEGVIAKVAGPVEQVGAATIVVAGKAHPLVGRPDRTPAESDKGGDVLPGVARWQTPVVAEGDFVEKKQLLARGATNIYYPANLWVFAGLVMVLGMVIGTGSGSVFKAIADRSPKNVGAVGGMVSLIGALGGFLMPPVFAFVFKLTGLWASTWWILAALALACLLLLHAIHSRILREEAPDLVRLIERGPETPGQPVAAGGASIEAALAHVPSFAALTPEELKGLAQAGTLLALPAGDEVFHEGDAGETLFIVLSGSVTVHHRAGAAVLCVGDFFGELSLLDGGKRSATVSVRENASLFVLERRVFLTMLSRSPRLMADLLHGLSRKLRGIALQP